MLMATYTAHIDEASCVGCGACLEACPAGAIIMTPGWRCVVQEALCLGCGICAGLCHKGAPQLQETAGSYIP